MFPLYFLLLLASLSIPLLSTLFYIDLIKKWRYFIFSSSVMAVVFLVWDAIFTHFGIWGFNEEYCLGIYFLDMPLEEWLFFFVIPYCSLYLHYALFELLPDLKLSKGTTFWITIPICLICLVLILTNLSRGYTLVNFSILIILIAYGLRFQLTTLQQFLVSYVLILIPFFIVNGVLTGMVTDSPVVWYNETEFMGFRVLSIPMEDFGYAFSMLFGNLLIFEALRLKKTGDVVADNKLVANGDTPN